MSKEASTHIDLSEVIAYAQANESPWAREPGADGAQWGIHRLDPPPHNRLLGPVSARGPASGVILLGGREVAHWGEPDRPDLTFSIAKTYLALLAGVAFDRGLIADLDAPIGASVHGIGFEGAHNGSISWRHMLQMCSEWSGACWGIPDQVDHFRTTTPPWPGAEAGTKGEARTLRRAGTYWEYNDVRVNQFSLALLHLFGRPLPEVFREAIAGPAGASDDWRWDGYDNAWTTVQGRKTQSVPGGTHWGGGVTISARDQARIGQMLLRRGLGKPGGCSPGNGSTG
ncbi:MAG: serine hydrolase [Burkholderiaceae bacterium]